MKQDLRAYCDEYAWYLDDGSLADTEDGEDGAGTSSMTRNKKKSKADISPNATNQKKKYPDFRKKVDAALAKKRRPVQRKIQERVPVEALRAVDEAVQAPERKSASGRILKRTRRAG